MKIQLDSLTIDATVHTQSDDTHFEITSIRDQAGEEQHGIPATLLDEIEEALQDAWQVEQYESMILDNEVAHLTNLYLWTNSGAVLSQAAPFLFPFCTQDPSEP